MQFRRELLLSITSSTTIKVLLKKHDPNQDINTKSMATPTHPPNLTPRNESVKKKLNPTPAVSTPPQHYYPHSSLSHSSPPPIIAVTSSPAPPPPFVLPSHPLPPFRVQLS
jgi:hypothetical protein